jgi:hypothetical protein
MMHGRPCNGSVPLADLGANHATGHCATHCAESATTGERAACHCATYRADCSALRLMGKRDTVASC